MSTSTTAGTPGKAPKWNDINRELGRWRVYAPDTSWIHVILAEEIKSQRRFLRLSRYHQGFNIKSPEDLTSIVLGLEEAAEGIGWKPGYKGFFDKIGKTKFRTKEDEGVIRHLKERARRSYHDNLELKQEILRLQLPEFKQELNEFKSLLDAEQTETKVHDWLKTRIWVFGTDYANQQPKSFSEVGWGTSRFDFFLLRTDAFYDIIELKSPSEKLFIRRAASQSKVFPSRDSPFSSALQKSISQMIGYIERASIYEYPMLRLKGIFVHKPKGIIVIGRTKPEDKEAIKTLNSYLHQIEVLTYDDLLNRAKEFVELITTTRKPKPPPEPTGAQGKPTTFKVPAKFRYSRDRRTSRKKQKPKSSV